MYWNVPLVGNGCACFPTRFGSETRCDAEFVVKWPRRSSKSFNETREDTRHSSLSFGERDLRSEFGCKNRSGRDPYPLLA